VVAVACTVHSSPTGLLSNHQVLRLDDTRPRLVFFTLRLRFLPFSVSAIDRYLGNPAAFVVDKFFPSAFSPYSLLSINAVVGRAFTYSMFSFHNSARFIPTSRTISQAHSCLSTLFRLPPCQFRSPFQSMLSRLELVWSYSELDFRRRQVTLHFAFVTSRS
jgi:hypothetical protein